MQSKLEVLTTRVNEVEERVSDIEDKLMAKRENEEKRDTQLKEHEGIHQVSHRGRMLFAINLSSMSFPRPSTLLTLIVRTSSWIASHSIDFYFLPDFI